MTPLPLSPFISNPDERFVLDEEAFMAAIGFEPEPEPMPLFLAEPRREFLRAVEIEPILRVLAGPMTAEPRAI